MSDLSAWVEKERTKGLTDEQIAQLLEKKGWPDDKIAAALTTKEAKGLPWLKGIPLWFASLAVIQLILGIFLKEFFPLILIVTIAGYAFIFIGAKTHHTWIWRIGVATLCFLICWPLVVAVAAMLVFLFLITAPWSIGMMVVIALLALFPKMILAEQLYTHVRKEQLGIPMPPIKTVVKRSAIAVVIIIVIGVLVLGAATSIFTKRMVYSYEVDIPEMIERQEQQMSEEYSELITAASALPCTPPEIALVDGPIGIQTSFFPVTIGLLTGTFERDTARDIEKRMFKTMLYGEGKRQTIDYYRNVGDVAELEPQELLDRTEMLAAGNGIKQETLAPRFKVSHWSTTIGSTFMFGDRCEPGQSGILDCAFASSRIALGLRRAEPSMKRDLAARLYNDAINQEIPAEPICVYLIQKQQAMRFERVEQLLS